MTTFKDWNEAHFNGYRAREAADFIWTEDETKASAQADAAPDPGGDEQAKEANGWGG